MTVCLRGGRRWAAITMILCAGLCARAAVFDFADVAQFEHNFEVYTSGALGEGHYTWTDAPGAAGEPGRIDIGPVYGRSLSVLSSAFTFDLNVSPVDVSILFQGGAAEAGAVPRIGLLLHSARGVPDLGATLLRTLWLQDGQGLTPARLLVGEGGGSAEEDALAAFTVGHWYGMRSVWSLDEQGGVRITGELWDYGAQGAEPVSLLVQLTTLITDPALFGAGGVVAPLYLGIVAQHGLGGAAALDQIRIAGDFSAVFIPEPALAVACMLGVALLGCALRRRAFEDCQRKARH